MAQYVARLFAPEPRHIAAVSTSTEDDPVLQAEVLRSIKSRKHFVRWLWCLLYNAFNNAGETRLPQGSKKTTGGSWSSFVTLHHAIGRGVSPGTIMSSNWPINPRASTWSSYLPAGKLKSSDRSCSAHGLLIGT